MADTDTDTEKPESEYDRLLGQFHPEQLAADIVLEYDLTGRSHSVIKATVQRALWEAGIVDPSFAELVALEAYWVCTRA